MSLVLGDNFSYQGAKPLDARLKYDTLAQMKAMSDSVLYDGCLAFCKEDSKTYQWISTNEVDATTGRWREFKSGSGGSSVTLEYDTVPTKDSTKLMKSGDLKTAFDAKQDSMSELTADEVDSICTYTDDNPLNNGAYMLFPNTWTPGVEYNFGHEVYGQRYIGTYKSNATEYQMTNIILETAWSGYQIIQCGGGIQYEPNAVLQLGFGGNNQDGKYNTFSTGLYGFRGSTLGVNVQIAQVNQTYSYDVWLLYTKEA